MPAASEIRVVPIASLTPHPRNPREGDVDAIRESIRTNGWYGTVVVQASTGYVCAGNHRMRAAAAEGMTELPAEFLDIDDATALRIVLADNRTSDRAGYRDDVLAELLAEVRDAGDLVGTAFDDSYLDRLLNDVASARNVERAPSAAAEPEPAAAASVQARVAAGEIWQVGPHRLMCGDARNPAHVAALLDGQLVNLAVTSPPYAEQRAYDEASGFKPIPPDDYVAWFAPAAAAIADNLAADGSWLVNIKPSVDGLGTSLYVLDLVAAHVREWGWHLATEFCWERNGVPKQPVLRLKNQFEPVYQFVRDRWKFRPENVRHQSDDAIISLGPGSGDTSWARGQGTQGAVPVERIAKKKKGGGRGGWGGVADPNDIQGKIGGYAIGEASISGWAYPGNRLPTFVSTHEATGHTAAFPVGLPQFFTLLFTDEGDAVYDPFLGSGSTLLAAHNTGRVGYGMELSAAYCDIALDRLERHTGLVATPVTSAATVA